MNCNAYLNQYKNNFIINSRNYLLQFEIHCDNMRLYIYKKDAKAYPTNAMKETLTS